MTSIPILEKATFIKRYKRFFADIETAHGPLTVHVPNTGSMKGCLAEGADCLYSPTDDPKRKLKGTLQFIKTTKSWVGVNTALPNQLVKDFWTSRLRREWNPYSFARLEYKINEKTRLDMVMAPDESDFEQKRHLHFVEVKNVTLAENDLALFPDAVTTRGQKHLEELMELASKGFGAEIFFVVQRTDCKAFSPCKEIDPVYSELLKKARDSGVIVSAYPCWIDEKKGVGITNSPLKILI